MYLVYLFQQKYKLNIILFEQEYKPVCTNYSYVVTLCKYNNF